MPTLIRIVSALLACSAACFTIPASAQQWDATMCNERLEGDLALIDEDKAAIADLLLRLDVAQRSGKTDEATYFAAVIESRRVDGIGSVLRFLDRSILPICDQAQLRPDLLQRLAEARSLVDVATPAVTAETPPDLQIANITSTFVPYVLGDNGACSGPFLDLTFQVVNRGGPFPRPVDVETRTARLPPEVLAASPQFSVLGTLDFGNGNSGSQQRIPVQIAALDPGAALEVPLRIRIGDDTPELGISAVLEGGAFLDIAPTGTRSTAYAARLPIPIWDMVTVNVITVSRLDKGQHAIDTLARITNLGQSATPGPVEGSFALRHPETRQVMAAWTGISTGPVESGAAAVIHVLQPTSTRVEKPFIVESTLTLLCPGGGYNSSLSDGDRKSNSRVLKQQ